MSDPVDRAALAARTAQAVAMIGQSQRTIAARVGVSHAFLSQIINGKTLPSLQIVVGLHQEYGISMVWYLIGAGPPLLSGGLPDSTPETEDITHNLVPTAIALGPQAQAQLRGYLHSMLDSAHQRRRAQAS